jgi:molybdenum cofactor biosynthesis enzyme MoaA
VKQKRDLIDALWKEIGNARQRGTPKGEITAVDRSGVNEIMAPKLSKHIKQLRAHLRIITTYPVVAVSHVPEQNDMVEYDEADTETMKNMDASSKELLKELTVTDIHYYSERAKSELHLTDMKANTKMQVTARPMFKETKVVKNKLPRTIYKRNEPKTYLLTPEYGCRSTSEHIAIHTKLNI